MILYKNDASRGHSAQTIIIDVLYILVLQANESNRPVPSRSARDNNNYSSERDRPTEEAERVKENQDVEVSCKSNNFVISRKI